MSAEPHSRGQRPRRGLPRPAAVVGALTGLSLVLTSCGTNPFAEEERVQSAEPTEQSETSPEAAGELPEVQTPLPQEVAQQVGYQRETIAEAGETLQQMQDQSQQAEQQEQEEAAQQEQDPEDAEDPADELDEGDPEEGAVEESDEPVEPPTDATYPTDLNQALEQIAENYPGEFSISVAEVTGEGRLGSYDAGETRISASTYKLYVAYSVMLRVEAGQMSWDDEIEGGRDLDECFHDMLALSDNPCPEEIADEIGWDEIYSDAASVGTMNSGQNDAGLYTTAADLTTFLAALQSGTLDISPEGHDRILQSLAANIHRLGVPSGTPGTVMNKPGFLNEYLHDAAIVHHPQGTYVLTVMSEGSNWESLAAITQEVEAALYG